MRIGLVVTDLDGTLWEAPGAVHPETVSALAEIERHGYALAVATGRRLRSTREPLAELGLAPPAVVFNGALAVDLASGDRLHRRIFPPDTAAAVLTAFLELGIEPCVYVDHEDVDVFVGSSPSTHPLHLQSFGRWVQSADLQEVVATLPVFSFGLLGQPTEQLRQVAAALDGIVHPHVQPDREYGGSCITVAPPELSKWVGVETICRTFGFDAGAVLAIGDGPNDVELLTRAAVAVVPADAHPAARACADHVIGRAADGGWAGILDLLERGTNT
jgi:hydroxymethylpyrimidine pyrophosphatase-like HAD family hydrolase